MVLSNKDYLNDGEWQFVPCLRMEHVWDAFTLVSLLDDGKRYQQRLQVLHTGLQKDRFTKAMEERNKDTIYNGQPDMVRHACDKCFRTYKTVDGKILELMQPIVGDGLSMGRPCCGVFRCTEPLQSNRHCFCFTHFDEHQKCAIVGCEAPVVSQGTAGEGSKTCSNAEHRKMEAQNKERSTSTFILKERFKKMQISHPTEFFAATTSDSAMADDVEEHQEWFEVSNSGRVIIRNEPDPGTIGVDDGAVEPCPSKATSGNCVVKAQFGQRRTHNEQTLVRPCGMIYAQATMFGAEAVSNFLVMIKNAFSVPGASKPEHIFYDTNCQARKQAEKDPWFADIGMCVDVWHFLNKHAQSDAYCQEFCSAAGFPELLDKSGKWLSESLPINHPQHGLWWSIHCIGIQKPPVTISVLDHATY
ncbi:hypothetical protein BJ912DRAFT_844352 [Pholiota molesta]|nr:hypothetical protein BJ912DRAFT_844352 [Pholiota molesta]